jgi:hypothetical protein
MALGQHSTQGLPVLAQPTDQSSPASPSDSASWVRPNAVVVPQPCAVASLPVARRWPPPDEVFSTMTRTPRGWRQAMGEG